MSTVKLNNCQIGQSLTSTNNFTWYQPSVPDGTVRLGVGNAGATSLDAITVNSSGNVTFAGSSTLSGGTANGVAYLNGSKVLTTGSALTFDGTTLNLGGTAQRITGDFNNATVANRVFFQNSAAATTWLGVLPGSGSTQSQIAVYNNSDPTNASYFRNVITPAEARIDSNITGTGSYLPLTFYTNGSEQMRLTSTGLGIGTSSPTQKLHVAGNIYSTSAAGTDSWIYCATNGVQNTALGFNNSGSTNANGVPNNYSYIGNLNAYGLTLLSGGTPKATLDTAGNLGLGVTPSAWRNTGVTFQNPAGGLWSYGTGYQFLGQNYYYNSAGNRIYSTTAAASEYEQTGGQHIWWNAPSGTAGTTATFTQAMTLDASGNLGVGTSSPTTKFQVSGVASTNNTSRFVAKFTDTSAVAAGNGGGIMFQGVWTGTSALDCAGIQAYKENATDGNYSYAMTFATRTNGGDLTERMRITSGGEVYIAGTTDQGAYNLQCNGTGVWGAGAYVNGSDVNLKENITDLADSLDIVNAIRPVTYTYKEDYSKDRSTQTGFIAQELQEVLADQVYVDGVVQAGPEYLNVAYQNLIPLLVKSIQELTARVEQLEAK